MYPISDKLFVFISIHPESKGNLPRIIFINVVLPQPLGPKSPYLYNSITFYSVNISNDNIKHNYHFKTLSIINYNLLKSKIIFTYTDPIGILIFNPLITFVSGKNVL